MSEIKRRDFILSVAGAAACLNTFGRPVRAEDPAPPPGAIPPPPQVPLGTTGITLSRVGHGTGMHGGNRQSNHTRMGFEKLVDLLRHSAERGITFFDMADLYGTHVYFREVLRTVPREKLTLLTKLWWRYDGEPKATPPEFQRRSCRMAIERFRHELSTDVIDIVLLHCLTEPSWEKEMAAYMETLSEAKERKHVRAVGVSCHDIRALRTAAACPWVDVILAGINSEGASMDGKPDDVIPILREARKNGKAIIGMKIYGEGKLAGRKEECIRFAQELGLLDCMTVGAETKEQMDETLALLARFPAVKMG